MNETNKMAEWVKRYGRTVGYVVTVILNVTAVMNATFCVPMKRILDETHNITFRWRIDYDGQSNFLTLRRRKIQDMNQR